MSAFVWADEVAAPYFPDFTNPDTDNLLTLQFDDGTTVTNCLTGATGETFATANIVGVAQGSKRVSATWSTSKPSGIDANPFSLLQTAQDVQQQYGLKLTTAGESISIPFVGSYTGTITYADNTTAAISGTGTYTLNGTTPIHIKKITATHNTSVYELFDFNRTSGSTVTSETTGLVCTLSGLPTDSGYVRGTDGLINGYRFVYGIYTTFPTDWIASQDFKITIDITPERSGGSNDILLATSNSFLGFWNSNFFVGGMNSNLRIAPLTQNQKTTVTIERVGTSTTLTDSFTGNTKNIALSGNYVVKSIMSATSQYPSAISRIQLEDISTPSNSRNYDFTTGDTGKIPDTISANHATITNARTSGFLPIVPTKVYNLHASGTQDYTNLRNAVSALHNPTTSVIYDLVVNSDLTHPDSQWFPNNNSNVDLTWIFRGSKSFNGSKSSVYAIKNTTDTFSGSAVFFDSKTNLHIKDLFLDDYSFSVGSGLTQGILQLERVIVDKKKQGSGSYFLSTDRWGKGVHARDSIFLNCKTSINNGAVSFSNCIGIDCSGSFTEWANFNNDADCTNCVSVLTPNHYNYGTVTPKCFDPTVTGNNNVSSDASAITPNSLINQPIESWFTNAAGSDYTINTTGQTALKTNGWNGSDIVSWAYAVTSGVTGTLAVTLYAASSSSSGSIGQAISGTLNDVLSNAILVATGSLTSSIDGTLASTLDSSALSATGLIGQSIFGTINVSFDSNILAAVGTIGQAISGSLNKNIANNTLSSFGLIGSSFSGALALTLNSTALLSSGVVGQNIIGALAETFEEASGTHSGLIGQNITGSLATTLFSTSLLGQGIFGNSIIGGINIRLEDSTLLSTGQIGQTILGSLNTLLSSCSLTGTGVVTPSINGALSVILGQNILTSSGIIGEPIVGTLNKIFLDNALNGSGVIGNITAVIRKVTINGIITDLTVKGNLMKSITIVGEF